MINNIEVFSDTDSNAHWFVTNDATATAGQTRSASGEGAIIGLCESVPSDSIAQSLSGPSDQKLKDGCKTCSHLKSFNPNGKYSNIDCTHL